MSESATNVPIEDVLSSIKRLVTEEGRDGAARKKPKGEASAPPRLVLTPALRVADDTPEVEEAGQPFQLSAEFVAPVASDEIRFRKEERVIDPDAPWSDPDVTLHEAAAAVVETREEASEAMPPEESAPAPAVEEAEGTDTVEFDAEAEELSGADMADDTETVVFEDLSDDDLLSDSQAGLEPEPLEWGENGDDQSDMQDDVPSPDAEDTGADDHSDPGSTLPETHQEAGEASEVQPIDMRTATLSQKIQALEAAIAQTEDQWEPDGDRADTDYAARPVKTIPWEDETPEPVETLRPETPEVLDTVAFPEPEPEATEEDAAILDEETLRLLVSDIVREELQGALGERITRNVRKLVRREIHRALTTKELD